ncbi:DUF6065 family protein [Arsenicicoccus sp. UBA7492]|uniref:DUF6065 family protein n=1 Tax=Arsenicicoccus sp. UBA7492 TaxID=1946057 RepID=UPI0039C8B110
MRRRSSRQGRPARNEATCRGGFLPATRCKPGGVVFERDEPICFISPVRRGDLEQITATVAPLVQMPDLAAYEAWSAERRRYRTSPREGRFQWQHDYFNGQELAGQCPVDHSRKLRLSEFNPARELKGADVK